MSISQSSFQHSYSVILVLQLLCDCDKWILHYFESILNVVGQGVGHHICNFLELSNDFIKPMLHLVHLSLHPFNLLTMLAHCICHLLDNPFQDNKSVLHFVNLGLPLDVAIICMWPNHGWPSKYLHFTCKGFVQGTQEFVSRHIQNSVIKSMFASLIGSVIVMSFSSFSKCLVHLHNSGLGLLKGWSQFYSQVMTSSTTRPFISSQTTKYVIRLCMWWVSPLDPHQTFTQTV